MNARLVFTLGTDVASVAVQAAEVSAWEELQAAIDNGAGVYVNGTLNFEGGTITGYELQQKRDMIPVEMHVLRIGDVVIRDLCGTGANVVVTANRDKE